MRDSPDFIPPQPSPYYYPQSFRTQSTCPSTPSTFHNSESVRFSKPLDPVRTIMLPEDRKKNSHTEEEQRVEIRDTPLTRRIHI